MLTPQDTLTFALKVAAARDLSAYALALRNIADAVGATSHVALPFGADRPGQTSEALAVFDIPSTYVAVFDDPGRGLVDPVMQHLRQSPLPVLWGRSFYCGHDAHTSYAAMADSGMRAGVDLALHLGPTRHFVLGYTWARDDQSDEERAAAVALVQTVAVFAEPTLYSLMVAAQDPQPAATPLTPRELECLYWVSRGMTDELVASILEIAHRTVRKHVDSAVSKLGASNRTEAAVRATRLGLLLQPPSRTFDR